MSWIKTIAYGESTGRLRRLYDKVKGPNDNVDNIMLAHSLRPHTMEGHMALYKYALHHSGNSLPKWFSETIGLRVSSLNRCDYCVSHHFAGLKRLLHDDVRAEAILVACHADDLAAAPLTAAQKLALEYATRLTQTPWEMRESMVKGLRDGGFSDGEILEINQVTGYFNYANRTVLGLGCTVEGDVLGLSPNQSDNPDDWAHQ